MARRRGQGKRPIESYDHRGEERLNNPPVGLVTPDTDRDAGGKTYEYDPHLDGAGSAPQRIVVSFGPEHAPLEQRQVAAAIEEAQTLVPRPRVIVFAAFQFDPEAAKDIDETHWPGVALLKAQMNADLLTDDLKKKRASNESFWLIGQPDVVVDSEEWIVLERRLRRMGSLQSYRELIAWQKSMSLAEMVYRLSSRLPKEETYGMRSQLTRAAVSIPANIAEGQARHGTGEFLHFLGVARGSLAELETLLTLCGNLDLLPQANVKSALNLCDETGRLLTGLVKSLRP